MTRRLQLWLLTLSALVVLAIGVILLIVLVAGMYDGVAGSGALVLGLVILGVFALGVRLLLVARATSRAHTQAGPRPRPR